VAVRHKGYSINQKVGIEAGQFLSRNLVRQRSGLQRASWMWIGFLVALYIAGGWGMWLKWTNVRLPLQINVRHNSRQLG